MISRIFLVPNDANLCALTRGTGNAQISADGLGALVHDAQSQAGRLDFSHIETDPIIRDLKFDMAAGKPQLDVYPSGACIFNNVIQTFLRI